MGLQAYGAQAVVVSIDPRRVYVSDPASTQRPTVRTEHPGPNGEHHCWCARFIGPAHLAFLSTLACAAILTVQAPPLHVSIPLLERW